MEKEQVKKAADKIVTVDELVGLCKIMAMANIAEHGYYSFTQQETGEKVFVE